MALLTRLRKGVRSVTVIVDGLLYGLPEGGLSNFGGLKDKNAAPPQGRRG